MMNLMLVEMPSPDSSGILFYEERNKKDKADSRNMLLKKLHKFRHKTFFIKIDLVLIGGNK